MRGGERVGREQTPPQPLYCCAFLTAEDTSHVSVLSPGFIRSYSGQLPNSVPIPGTGLY